MVMVVVMIVGVIMVVMMIVPIMVIVSMGMLVMVVMGIAVDPGSFTAAAAGSAHQFTSSSSMRKSSPPVT